MKPLLALLLMLFGLAAAPAAPPRDWTTAIATTPTIASAPSFRPPSA